MRLNRTMKLSLTVSIIIFLLIGFLPLTDVLAIQIYENDGIWTDTFDNPNTIQILSGGTSKCVWTDETIMLTNSSTGGRTYSFADGSAHRAYYYQSFFPINGFLTSFYSPAAHTERAETQFDNTFQYPYIQQKGEAIHRYADPSSTQGLNQYTVQHFRMKLQGSAEAIGNLSIYWYGKADNAKKIEMLYWNYGSLYSSWKRVASSRDTGDIILSYNMSEKQLENAIGSDGYFDFCIVAQKKYFTNPQCSLYTDYVELKSEQQQGYRVGYGLVQTKDYIELRKNAYWEMLAWDDSTTASAKTTYQILYYNGSAFIPVEDEVLPGNEEGFSTSPVSLVPLADYYPAIMIRANLSTSDPSVTPKVFSWTLTWQTMNRWQDLFSTEYRIGEQHRVNINNASINISLVSGDWPMFGQNPGNTRASTGKAAYSEKLYWWSDYHLSRNQTPVNPVVDNGVLYIPMINNDFDTGSLYKYSPIVVTSANIGKEFSYQRIIPFSSITNGSKIVSSPAVSDNYLIVATGDEYAYNYVYAFNKNTRSLAWTFDFNNLNYTSSPSDICYWSSPTIADGKVFLTSWSGQPILSGYHLNNMVLALDLSNGRLLWNYTFPVSSHPYLAPTWSFSTPAYADGKVVAACMNNQSDNLFALNAENGSVLWNISVGTIGRASPVIDNGTVYIVNELKVTDGIRRKTQLTAVDLDNGTVLWQTALGRTLITLPDFDPTSCLAESTPAIANGVLYVTSPDGLVTALDLTNNGAGLWTHSVYNTGVYPFSSILTSSPAYADGLLYVGTPSGYLRALDTSAHGNESWYRHTFPPEQNLAVVTDPIVTNGLVFFGASNGRFYVCGNYTTNYQAISGNFTSIPIQLPEGAWWKKFYAKVRTNSSTLNTITFSLLDANGKFIKVLYNGSDISNSNQTLGRTLQLRADFWAKNSTVNPKLIWWNVTFYKDFRLPYINMKTLDPNPEGWLNQIIPKFTVQVQDIDTGLLVSSAQYTLGYIAHNQTYTDTFPAQCTGVNGTTAIEQITVNLTKLDFYQNITALRSLRINISDLAGNIATQYITFQQDMIKPGSYVKKQLLKSRYNANANYVLINATAFDNGTEASGVKLVDLYYRYSTTTNFSGSWIYFGSSASKNPSWKFNFTNSPTQHGGYFEVCTIATDYAGNVEDFPIHGDAVFLYDWRIPDLPSVTGEVLWFNELPRLSVGFTDDYMLDTIQYRPDFATTWTTIATHVNSSDYDTPWDLLDTYWDQMDEGTIYYLYFKINDSVGNIRFVTEDADAAIIRKDTTMPNATVRAPVSEAKQILDENFTISANVTDYQGSGVRDVSLFYRYSGDNSDWSDWQMYGTTLYAAPYDWTFNATNGDGYYEFKTNVTDIAGNAAESPVFDLTVAMFPMTLVIVMVLLVIFLLFLVAVLYMKWRTKEQEQH
jgi:outer membrane protein assembly factor BamB